MNNEINSENLSSILFFSKNTYASGAVQASYLANREYGAFVEGLGTLSKTSDGDSYWSEYSNIIYEETEFKFNRLTDIYGEALTYASQYVEDYRDCAYIKNGRYTALYSYQVDLGNNFGNANNVVFNDLKKFLCSLNWQTFNKSKMYNGENEVNSIRIGIRTFDWHNADEITFSELIEDEYTATYSYSYDYTVIDENEVEHIESYSFSYDYIVPAVYLDHHFGEDNYYAYIKKQYVPIDETLHNEISYDLAYFEDTHSNNEDNYTYYMNECSISIPMILSTRSLGTKKSTFIANFDSDYSGWFYDTIKFNASIDTEGNAKKMVRITSGVDNTVFSIRKNENEKFGLYETTINADETKSIWAKGATNDVEPFGLTTPYKMKELDLSPITQNIVGTLDLSSSNWMAKGNIMKSLVIGSDSASSGITKIFGLNNISNLEYLNITNVDNLINTPSISNLSSLKVLDASGSNITAFKPKENSTIYEAWLPETIKSIKLSNVTIEPGSLNVMGEHVDFFGRINYEPTAELQSFTCVNTPNFDTYEFVKKWITALKYEDKLQLKELIYLELNGINWSDVPVQMMYDLKEFDLDVNESTERKGLEGTISIFGTGNYGLLTIEEYSKILRLYGRNALLQTGKEKVFSDLKIILRGNMIEPYEFYLKVSNMSLAPQNAANIILDAKLEFTGIENSGSNGASPIASIAFIDILNESTEPRTLEFEVDKHEKYAFCKLNKSIDTTNSIEATPKTGDIMLFNGDTILIFLGAPTNNYKYVKLGSITDKKFTDAYSHEVSALSTWFNADSVRIKFAPIEKPNVTSSVEIVNNNGRNYIIPDSDELEDKELYLTVSIDAGTMENIDVSTNMQNSPIIFEQDGNEITVANSSSNTGRDITSKINAKLTFTDEYVSSLGIDAENLVKDSFDVSIAKSASYDEETGTISLSSKLYSIENDTLISIDDNVMSIEEDENNITITLK